MTHCRSEPARSYSGFGVPAGCASVFKFAAFGFDRFGEGFGFSLFVGQFGFGVCLFERSNSGQEFFASFGDAKHIIFLLFCSCSCSCSALFFD